MIIRATFGTHVLDGVDPQVHSF